jgi:DNA-binding response OmpR family regulator
MEKIQRPIKEGQRETREGELEEQERVKEKISPSSHPRHQNKYRNILLVDDESDICLLYQMVLDNAGYKCDSYTDPFKAIQEFRPDYYDLVILDIKMPKLNGFELCRIIRKQDKSVKITFITASELYHEQIRSKHYSDLDNIYYIQKPIGNDELKNKITAMIKNSKSEI